MSDFELYPDEQEKVAAALAKLSNFEFSDFSETSKAIFNSAAHNEFGQAGFRVEIEWKEIYKNGLPTGVHLPHVEIVGRNKVESEVDHDRYRWGVVRGLADGQPGYVREDGSKREDPIKKIILP